MRRSEGFRCCPRSYLPLVPVASPMRRWAGGWLARPAPDPTVPGGGPCPLRLVSPPALPPEPLLVVTFNGKSSRHSHSLLLQIE